MTEHENQVLSSVVFLSENDAYNKKAKQVRSEIKDRKNLFHLEIKTSL